jgi:hypothetical protein
MNKLKFITLAMVLSLGVFAQNQQEVSDLLDEYEKAMVARQWTKSLDYVYPSLFDILPRDLMEQSIATTFNDTSVVRMGFERMELLEVSEVFEEEGLRYSFADYSMIMTMTSVSDNSDEQLEMLKNTLAMQFGEENIRVDGKTLYITSTNKMAVIRKKGEENLYMLELKPEMKEMIQSFMSEEFMQRAFES